MSKITPQAAYDLGYNSASAMFETESPIDGMPEGWFATDMGIFFAEGWDDYRAGRAPKQI